MTSATERKAKLGRRLGYLARHPWHAVLHPHQRLWNLYLTPVAKRVGLRKPLILADSLLLWAEVLLGRLRRRDARRGTAASDRVVVIDLGQHVDPRQITAMLDWFGTEVALEIYGFEAHPDYFEAAKAKLAERDNVVLENLALVGPDFAGDHVRLYLAGGRGVGDSIYARRSDDFITVPAVRLSRYLADKGVDLAAQPVILRMNIEGAEFGVLQDLAEAGLLEQIDGFFGSWDDMYKTDPKDDERFRAFLRRHRIRSIPFNDRDLGAGAVFAFRKGAIRYALRSSMMPRRSRS